MRGGPLPLSRTLLSVIANLHRFAVDLSCPTVTVEEEWSKIEILQSPMARQYVAFLHPLKKPRRLVEACRNGRNPKVKRPGQPGQYRRAG